MPTEETTNTRVEENVEDTETDYIAALKELKNNTVSKESFEKLQKENKQLLQTLIEGGQMEAPAKENVKPINEQREELFNQNANFSNLEFAERTLELRNSIMESGGVDPFLPYGSTIQPTAEDVEAAERVASILKECVDYAEGDSLVFTNELQRRMVDIKRR